MSEYFVPAPVRPMRDLDPLSVLAVISSDDAADIQRERLSLARQALRTFERVETVRAYRDLGLGHCAIASTWLENRRSGERHIRVATRGGLDLTTTVDIS